MFSTFLTVALLVTTAIQGVLAELAINSPDLVQCKPALISWAPTKGPYNLIVVKSSDPCGDALVDVGDFNTTSINWTAKIPAGTQVQLSLVDADDNEAWSSVLTVGSNSDASCLTATGSGSSTSAAATTSAPADTTAPAVVPTTTTSAGNTYGPDSSQSGVTPLGAANAGDLQPSAAFTVRQASTPLMVISGLVAAFAIAF